MKYKKIDFHGQPFRASAFTFPPFSILDREKNGTKHKGFEYMIAKTASKAIGLEMKISMPADGEKWGYSRPTKASNRNHTGINKFIVAN